ncbi:uncharacterized protein LOC123655101 [Melitaea cinxia]|uniref:uncharacterized protein LOC123655101 n=1 Tax=Melitaea cinxia TaxID=113334 RepID=UPI001E272AAC|nr:uncharacterized protein LOC123655101 [Melitaea cinxia]
MFVLAFVFIISANSLHVTYAAVTHPSQQARVVYPEPRVDNEVPERCKGLTYCTIKPKDYPEEKFKTMFKDYKRVPQPTMIVDLDNRQGSPDESDNCDSEVTYEPLYKVRENINAPWRTVVQVPEKDYIQRVRLERCTKIDAPCFNIFTPNDDFVTYCKQKTNVWEVLVAKGDNEIETIKAELPVCCSCHYKPKVDFMTRFGISKK